MTVYDYSFARPDLALLALGEGVMRYACSGSQNGKRLEQPELDALHAAGIPVGHVGENTTDPASWDGAEFWRQHLALGFPPTRPLFLADDGYTDPAHYAWVGQLLDATVIPLEARGIYGGAPLIQWCLDNGHATWGWITNALSWSGASTYDEAAAMAPGAHLQQLYNMSDIAGTDANRKLKPDCGLWSPAQGDDMTAEEMALALSGGATNNLKDAMHGLVNEEVLSILRAAEFDVPHIRETCDAINAKPAGGSAGAAGPVTGHYTYTPG